MEIKFVGNFYAPQHGETSHIAIDLRTETVTVYQRTPRGVGDGTPMDEWHGITRVYTADGETGEAGETHVDPDALREYIEGDGQELLERIFASGSVEWDGSNHEGRLTDDALEAEAAFETALQELPRASWVDWTCDEWFGQCMTEVYGQVSAQDARAFGDASTDPDVILDADPGDWCVDAWNKHHENDED
jgi:hypothetical protein